MQKFLNVKEGYKNLKSALQFYKQYFFKKPHKEALIEKLTNIEVWYQDNYDLLAGEYNQMYYDKSFEYEDEALLYIQSRLNEQIEEFIKCDTKASNEELLMRYRMYGTDYILKYSQKGFSSWIFVQEKLKE